MDGYNTGRRWSSIRTRPTPGLTISVPTTSIETVTAAEVDTTIPTAATKPKCPRTLLSETNAVFSLGRWKEDQKTRRRSPCCCVSSFSVFRIFFLSNFNDFEKNICARNFWYLISLLSLLHFWKGVFLNCSSPHPPQSNPVLAESLFLKKYYRVQTWYLRVLKLDSSVLKRERDTIGLWRGWSCYW